MLARWNPFNGGIARSPSPMPAFDDLFKEADALLRTSLLGDTVLPSGWSVATNHAPAADVLETEDEFHVQMDLPGHDPKSLQVKLEGDVLTVQSERKPPHPGQNVDYLFAERASGIFARSFSLPSSVDGSRCEAKYENGVLTVTLPKREDARPKSIQVKVQA
jgi:HSP20 family protein